MNDSSGLPLELLLRLRPLLEQAIADEVPHLRMPLDRALKAVPPGWTVNLCPEGVRVVVPISESTPWERVFPGRLLGLVREGDAGLN